MYRPCFVQKFNDDNTLNTEGVIAKPCVARAGRHGHRPRASVRFGHQIMNGEADSSHLREHANDGGSE
jgi:hypothetical protein